MKRAARATALYDQSVAVRAVVRILVYAALAALILAAWANAVRSAPVGSRFTGDSHGRTSPIAAPEVVVYVSELPKDALSEFDVWNDPAAPGGRLVGIPNNGDELDPPPENDPHVTFNVPVQGGVAYRCWIHMKVGAPKGKSQANVLFVQFSNAVDKSNKETLKPGSPSYLTARGPAREGWSWVGCDPTGGSSERLIQFARAGDVTVRVQGGMEGVGFDQFVLSPAKYLEKPPAEAVVKK